MKNILFLGTHNLPFKRQIPIAFKDEYTFWFNEYDLNKKYDIVIVLEYLEKNIKIKCGSIYFISGEPDTISTPATSFLKQFDIVFSTNRKMKIQKIEKKQFLPWHLGFFSDSSKYTFDYFTNINFLSQKMKNPVIAGISGIKSVILGHQQRYHFMNYCKFYFKDSFSLYGRGINDFRDKIDFLPQFKYQVVIENSYIEDYWTEKLADSFLSECYTFYSGCPNIGEYFPEKSYSIIDITKPFEAMEVIENAISHNFFEKHYEEILKSKKRVLGEYNLINYLTTIKETQIIKARKIKPGKSIIGNIFNKVFKNIMPYYFYKKLFRD